MCTCILAFGLHSEGQHKNKLTKYMTMQLSRVSIQNYIQDYPEINVIVTHVDAHLFGYKLNRVTISASFVSWVLLLWNFTIITPWSIRIPWLELASLLKHDHTCHGTGYVCWDNVLWPELIYQFWPHCVVSHILVWLLFCTGNVHFVNYHSGVIDVW